jgi:hypothetical protein
MAVVLHLGVSTILRAVAGKSAQRRLSATGKRGLKNSPATIASNLIEYSLATASTSALVTELLTVVISTFQEASAGPGTNVLRFKPIV